MIQTVTKVLFRLLFMVLLSVKPFSYDRISNPQRSCVYNHATECGSPRIRGIAAAFMNLKHTAERTDGVIPIKYRELMSVAVALTTQCAYCIESHINNAVQAGTTREEISETVFIAAALRAGEAVGTGLMAMRLFEEANSTGK